MIPYSLGYGATLACLSRIGSTVKMPFKSDNRLTSNASFKNRQEQEEYLQQNQEAEHLLCLGLSMGNNFRIYLWPIGPVE